MREIKFRAWDKRSKRMIQSDNLYRLSQKDNGIFAVEGSIGKESLAIIHGDLILEEFIGLKDKNGKRELYDGDRVVIGSDRGILVWDECDLCWSLQLDNNEGDLQALCRFYTYENMENIEYIGNIHEEGKP